MTREEIALNIACDLLVGSSLYGYDYDRIFDEIMERDGCVTSNDIKEFILNNLETLGKEYFVKDESVDGPGKGGNIKDTKPCPCMDCFYYGTNCRTDHCNSYLAWKAEVKPPVPKKKKEEGEKK